MEEQFIILLIEDNSAHAELFKRCLEDQDQKIIFNHVIDGEQGQDYLNNRNSFADKSENPRPNVILLDLKLPKVSGLQVLASIKKSDDLKAIPVIVFSSSQATPDIKKALELGANSYLTKPADFGTFSLLAESIISYWARWDQLSKI